MCVLCCVEVSGLSLMAVCDVGCVVVEVCCVVCGVVCGVVCVFLLSVRAGGVLFKTRTQYQGVLGKNREFWRGRAS